MVKIMKIKASWGPLRVWGPRRSIPCSPPPLSVGLHGHSWQYLGVRSTSQGEVALVVNERVRFLFT